ncbi:aldo/keto reductase [Paenibacillus sp. HB172176]|uniref:aldo/keto reductase n=1 Tax=Paenibacillus sp. HB172176 TaxID=2493690 RepID=UPI00143B3F2B|nr:aldo/keto reductase [Paenibacillus sp. HB172176]
MKYNRLGGSGLNVSALGLGTNAFGKRADFEASKQILELAIDSGINFIDTANIYAGTQSETIIGQVLEGRRHEVVLATKAGLPKGKGVNEKGSSRYHLELELEGSLRRLKTDYVDLYQIHTFDPNTPLEETLRALENMIASGKVRYIGASNYYAWELMKAIGISEKLGLNRFVSTQVSYSLADRTPERELVPMCLDQGVGVIPYFPLAAGILTGKYNEGQAPQGSRGQVDPGFSRFMGENNIELGKRVSSIAERAGCSPSVLSTAWLMSRPAVSTVIVGASRAEQLRENVKSAEFELTPEIVLELDEVSDAFRHGDPMAIYRL